MDINFLTNYNEYPSNINIIDYNELEQEEQEDQEKQEEQEGELNEQKEIQKQGKQKQEEHEEYKEQNKQENEQEYYVSDFNAFDHKRCISDSNRIDKLKKQNTKLTLELKRKDAKFHSMKLYLLEELKKAHEYYQCNGESWKPVKSLP